MLANVTWRHEKCGRTYYLLSDYMSPLWGTLFSHWTKHCLLQSAAQATTRCGPVGAYYCLLIGEGRLQKSSSKLDEFFLISVVGLLWDQLTHARYTESFQAINFRFSYQTRWWWDVSVQCIEIEPWQCCARGYFSTDLPFPQCCGFPLQTLMSTHTCMNIPRST